MLQKNEKIICFYRIKISEQTLKFGDIVVNKREFHASKEVIALSLTNSKTVMMVLNILSAIYMMMM